MVTKNKSGNQVIITFFVTFFLMVGLAMYLLPINLLGITSMTEYNKRIASQNETDDKYLIFQIGFNKAGTTSLYQFFKQNGIASIHFSPPKQEHTQTLSHIMFEQYINNKTILSHQLLCPYQYFGDFDVYIHNEEHGFHIKFLNDSYQFGKYKHWFQVLNDEYPKSLYILNIRPIKHWIRSKFTFCWSGCVATHILHQKEMHHQFHSHIEILNGWKQLWYKYICYLIQYFISHSMMDRLIIFDIENDSYDKLMSFFAKYDILLDATVAIYKKKTTKRGRAQQRQFRKWENITKTHPEFLDDEMDKNEYQNIADQCHIDETLLH